MEMLGILTKQIVLMGIWMGIGFYLYKRKYISDQGSKDIGSLLLHLVIPVIIFKNFLVENSVENINHLIPLLS